MILSKLRVLAATTCMIFAFTAPVNADVTPAANHVKTGSAVSTSEPAAPPAEQDGTPIPEPSNIIMLALGITGLVVGRFAAKRHRDSR